MFQKKTKPSPFSFKSLKFYQNKISLIQAAFLLILFIVVYYPFIMTMVHDWSVDDNYSHGFLIPFIAGFMVWSMRKELTKASIEPNNWGLFLFIIGMIQLIIAKIGAEFFLQRSSIILVFFGLSLFLLGKAITKKICIPVLYLVFMIPIPAIIWNKIAFPLKLFASAITTFFVQSIGIPILLQGNILYLANTTLEVADACSGLRSLISLLALSSAFAFISQLSKFNKMILFLSAFPIAILSNIIRLTGTAVLAHNFGSKVAHGFLHEISGMFVFILGLLLIYITYIILSKFEASR